MTAAPDRPWTLSRSFLGPFERIVLGAFGLAPLWGAWDLVIRPWPAARSLAGLPLLVIAVPALGIGTLLLGVALLAPGRELRVDPVRREIVEITGRRRGRPRRQHHPFDKVEEVVVRVDRWTDGPDLVELVLVLRDRRRPLVALSRPLAARPEVEALAARLRAALQA